MSRLTAVAALLLLLPRSADALTVSKAAIHVNPKKTDTAAFAGTLTSFGLPGNAAVSFTLDGVSYQVARSALKAGRNGKFTYRNKAKTAGVASLTLDLRKQQFKVTLARVILGSVRSPVTVEFSNGNQHECARVALATSAKHPPPDASTSDKERVRSRGFKLIKDKSGTLSQACLLPGPALDPPVRVVGEPPTVTARLQIATPVDAGSVKLFHADVAGTPQGDALCALLDDGIAAHGDATAGDGTFACVLAVDTATPQKFPVVATATNAGKILRSLPVDVRVAAPLSDADLAAHHAVQVQAEALWAAAKAALGDTLAARFQTLAALRLLAGVDAVTLSDEGGSIAIVFPTGVIGGLALTPRSDVPFGLPPGATPVPGPTPASATLMVRRDASTPSTPPEDAVVVGSHKVLVWHGAASLTDTEFDLTRTFYGNSTCPPFEVTAVDGDNASLHVLDQMTQYGTVVLITHGLRGRGAIGMMNSMVIENDREAVIDRKDELQHEELFLGGALTPTYVRKLDGEFAHAIVWGGFCNSGFDDLTGGKASTPVDGHTVDSLADAFLSKGVAAYFGFSRTVSNTYPRLLASTIFPSLIFDFATTNDVYDAANPKIDQPEIDDYNRYHNAFDPGAIAHFVLRPPNGKPVVYLKPALTPKNPSIDAAATVELGVTVEGSQGCHLAYHWTNTGTAGHLADGDDVQTADDTMAYQAELGAEKAHDTVTVDVLNTVPDPPRPLVRITTTVAVGCSTCDGPGCTPAEACCTDDLDNDGDGKTDCDDPDCEADPGCGYTLSGSSDGAGLIVADDDLDVYLNGVQIYTDGTGFAGTRPPISFAAKPGDVLRFVVRDTYGICTRLHTIYLTNRQHSVVADAGFDDGCERPDGDQGVTHDAMFMIPF